MSVIIPAYNAARYLAEAVNSILSQTLADFELLLIDDGSTDETGGVAASFTDPRVRVLTNEGNRGMAYSLNRGLGEARGRYIARMDADDVAAPGRLETQVRFLDCATSVGVVGAWFETFGRGSKRVIRHYTDHDRIAAGLLFGTQLGHPTVMFRGEFVRASGLHYNADIFPVDDWDYWVRSAGRTKLANIPEVLLRYRLHAASAMGTMGAEHGPAARTVRLSEGIYRRQLAGLGIEPTGNELAVHTAIGFGFPLPGGNVPAAESWLRRLLAANRRARVYSQGALEEIVGAYWTAILLAQPTSRARKVLAWAHSPLVRHSVRAGAREHQWRWQS